MGSDAAEEGTKREEDIAWAAGPGEVPVLSIANSLDPANWADSNLSRFMLDTNLLGDVPECDEVVGGERRLDCMLTLCCIRGTSSASIEPICSSGWMMRMYSDTLSLM